MIREIQHLDIITRNGASSKTCISVVQKFGNRLEPFFKIVEIFISSNPDIAALVWGSIRFVLKYDELFELCVEKPTQTQDEKSRSLMRLHIEAIYEDIFRVLHIATSVLVRPDGSGLVWKPFDARFGDVLDRMTSNRHFVLQQLVIWQTSKSSKEIDRAAAERDVSATEREDAALERQLAEEERRIMEGERALSSEHRQDTTARLDMEWISAPSYVDHYDRSLRLRLEGTASWIFQEEAYKQWLSRKGNPGSGKTILAASVIEELQRAEPNTECYSPVHYYFFDHHFPAGCEPSNAYRAIAAQILWENRTDSTLLDRLSFLMHSQKRCQLQATDAQLLDILHLCLDLNTILVLDGVDECTDSESLSQTLLTLSNRLPSLRFLLLSRVNVSALNLSVHIGRKFAMRKAKIRPDIYRFFAEKLEEMIEDDLLPATTFTGEEKVDLADHLCKGADGMFLWARLMTRCLRSAHLTREQRLRMIKEVSLPEGLEKMYERIVSVIHASSSNAASLASKVLTWLAFSIVPMSSRQLREAIGTQEGSPLSSDDDEVMEFEECVVMACAGLVEPSRIPPNSECPKGESGLRFIHLSLQELMEAKKNVEAPQLPFMVGPFGTSSEAVRPAVRAITVQRHLDYPHYARMEALSMDGPALKPTIFQPLVAGPMISHLNMATCCLQHLLYHSPAEPLSGSLKQQISEDDLNRKYCFISYSSVHWFSHLKSSLERMDISVAPSPAHVVEFLRLLSIFLANSLVLSSWLEAFYTSKYQRQAVGYHHPPMTIVQNWIKISATDYIGDRNQMLRLLEDVQAAVESLTLDIQNVVETWDTQLDKTPRIVWDEMTFFAKSRLFVSLGSVDVTVQAPEPPNYPGISDYPVAKMSKTSLDGRIKGILCIWAPRFIHDRRTFSNYRVTNRDRRNDIRWLCEGWVATYQVWEMDRLERPAAKIQLSLCAEDIIQPIRQYLDHPMASGLDLPLEIGADATSFCILRTVYIVEVAENPSDSKIFSQKLGTFTPHLESDFTWTAPNQITPQHSSSFYSFHFSPNGSFLVLHESGKDVSHLLAFECQRAVEDDLLVKLVNKLEIRQANVEQLCFHHNQPLLAFCVVCFRDQYIKRRVLRIWNFSHHNLDIVERVLSNTWGPESMTFSSCGTYLVIQPDFPKNGEPVVIRSPKVVSETASEVCSPPRVPSDVANSSSTADASAEESQALTASRGHSQELTKALASTAVTQVAASSTGTEVTLTRHTREDIQKSKVVTLPRSAHFVGAVHKILPRLSQEAMFKVSVDMDRRRHYSLDGHPVGSNAAVIEKHPAFVAMSSSPAPSTRTHVPGLGRLAVGVPGWTPWFCRPWEPEGFMSIQPASVPRPKVQAEPETKPEAKPTAPSADSVWTTISKYMNPLSWMKK
ncbi:hypothetical protein DL765_001570 [Monosporascus sp. GIB2]|nr:hypothetical protein DL765_001570 [Monosporascus sp. GIB2]